MIEKRDENIKKTDRGHPSKQTTIFVKYLKSIVLFSTIVFSASLFGIVVSHAQKAVDEGPEVITLNDYAVSNEAVTFTHKKHGKTGEIGADCMTCHHKSNKFVTPGKCSECHKVEEEEEVLNYPQAFHKLCIGCHKKEIIAGNEKVNLTCDSCHVSKK